MSIPLEEVDPPVLVGRSSSVFTRVARIFAAELGVDYALQVVPDLTSANAADYGDNPALKLPSLKTGQGILFGTLNICRELARLSTRRPRIVWPEGLERPLLANALELTLHAMATEVNLIMDKVAGVSEDSGHYAKMRKSLLGAMTWLEDNVLAVRRTLPDRDLSYLEVALFCLVTHLEFRSVLPIGPYRQLNEFCQGFAARPSAEQTAYRFDAA
jgi:glutathione S-transferase